MTIRQDDRSSAPPNTDPAVLDTSALISDPELLLSTADRVVVLPLQVVEELDGLKRHEGHTGWAARSVLRQLEELRGQAGASSVLQLPGGGALHVELNGLALDELAAYHLDPSKNDNRILAVALGLARQHTPHHRVRVVSDDAGLRFKAAQCGLVAEGHEAPDPQPDEISYRELHTAPATLSILFDDGVVPAATAGLVDDDGQEATLVENQFAVVRQGPSQSALVRRSGDQLVRIDDSPTAFGLEARNKEQLFALDLLLDSDIGVVALAGQAGTGKTLLALAAGLQQTVEQGLFEHVGVFRPVVPLAKSDLGFLPGSLAEKLDPWMAAIEDNLGVLDASGRIRDELTERGQLSFGSIAHARGRSIRKSFILVDEAQNLEPAAAKALVSRVGEGSKVVFTGDPSQVDSPYLSASRNAVSTLLAKLTGEPRFGGLALQTGERSDIAELAARRL